MINAPRGQKYCDCGEEIDDSQSYCSDKCAQIATLKDELAAAQQRAASNVLDELAHGIGWDCFPDNCTIALVDEDNLPHRIDRKVLDAALGGKQ